MTSDADREPLEVELLDDDLEGAEDAPESAWSIGPSGLAFTYAGVSSPGSAATRSFSTPITVRNTTDHQEFLDSASHPSEDVGIKVPELPEIVASGTRDTLTVTWTIRSCATTFVIAGQPHVDVRLIDTGGYVTESVPIPQDVLVAQIQNACPGSTP
jgi:hypothetical protein